MGQAGDLEKEGSEGDTRQLSELRNISSGSTLDETLDAEANIQPPGNTDPSPAVVVELSPGKNAVPGPPPNGGFQAWLQVFGSFFLFFNSW